MVGLVDVVNRKVGGVELALQVGLERGTDVTKLLPVHTIEEWVLLDVRSSMRSILVANTVWRVTEKARR